MADRTPTVDEVVAQLRSDVGAVAGALGALVDSSEDMQLLEQRIDSHAPRWAAQLLGDDDRVATRTALDLTGLLWPHSEPTLDWWSTPLGRAVVRSVGHPTATVVSYRVAGAMLGCSKQYVGQLIAAGRLTPGTTRGAKTGAMTGVTTSSVRALWGSNIRFCV